MTCFQIRQLCLSLIFLGPYLSFLLRCVDEIVPPLGLTWWTQNRRCEMNILITDRASSVAQDSKKALRREKYWHHQTSLSSGRLNLRWGENNNNNKNNESVKLPEPIKYTTVLAAAGPSLQGIYLPRQCLLKCRLSSLPQGYRCSSGFPFQEGEEPGCLAPLLEITSPQFLWKTVPTAQRKGSYRACPVGNRTCPVGCRSLNLKVGLKHWTNPLWSFSNRP